jgi:hypothetical protein
MTSTVAIANTSGAQNDFVFEQCPMVSATGGIVIGVLGAMCFIATASVAFIIGRRSGMAKRAAPIETNLQPQPQSQANINNSNNNNYDRIPQQQQVGTNYEQL